MKRQPRGPSLFVRSSILFALLLLVASGSQQRVLAAPSPSETPGSLAIVGKDGKIQGDCPLKHTDVRAGISGFLARVTVTQIFANTATQNVEAVYTFPLPQDAAVDDMTIQIGDRTVRGLIKRREEARAIYEHAKNTGHVAALLDQERPNIFTQSVANILPGAQVTVTISYVETLRYEEGSYEFVFPMVVGPRYIPGQATGQQGGGWAPDTTKVPDASRITPWVAGKGTRAGHDISLELALDAGVPIQELHSKTHVIDVDRQSASRATIRLRDEAVIPNKDFILRYDVAGEQVADAILTSPSPGRSKGAGGYFTMILQPPARLPESDIQPKELVFVLDTSGSMWGFPLDQAKRVISRALDELYPGDTFNLITFSGDTHIVFPEPVYPTAENIRKAKAVLASRNGGGGTEMMKAIRAALVPSDKQDHVRVVCFLTDGYVGNDMEIVGEVQKHPNARVFAFGIGNAVNRFLLDKMAEIGRGAVEYVTLADKADEAADRFYERVRSPLLTDLYIDWGGLPVTDVYPQRLPDLFSGQPLVITGRYTQPANGKVHLKGTRAGGPFTRDIAVAFSSGTQPFDALAGFWARRRIDDLMSQDWLGMQQGAMKPALQEQITQLGLDYRLMTQFTSFVAVEERIVTKDGQPQRVEVPVEMPEGVSHEGVFGEAKQYDKLMAGQAGGALGRSSNLAYIQPSTAASQTVEVQAAAPQLSTTPQNVFHGQLPAPAPPPPMGGPIAKLPTKAGSVAEGDHLADTPSGDLRTRDRRSLESKLQPAVLAALDCFRKATNASCANVHAGKIGVEIWLSADSTATRDQLRALGFELTQDHHGKKMLAGNLGLEKLEALARLDAVQFISLQRR
ncbi:MAG TPA: VIT and VWA domain-containing protein [Terriglobales bacterium]|nr:VIT and VWA domain-containing protein [Terriglobales bacterium]